VSLVDLYDGKIAIMQMKSSTEIVVISRSANKVAMLFCKMLNSTGVSSSSSANLWRMFQVGDRMIMECCDIYE